MPSKSRDKSAKASGAAPSISAPGRRGLRAPNQPGSAVGRKNSMRTTQSDESGKIGLLSVPPEIRDMIYRMILSKENPACTISTPGSRSDYVSKSNSIIYVNKQISDEALPILYSTRTFEFTNGISSPKTDAEVLRSFIATTRSHLVASITSVKLTAYLRMGYTASKYAANGSFDLMSGNDSYASNLREICQHMTKHMPNVKSLTVCFGPWGSSIHALRLFSRTATVSGLATSIRMLMKLAKLKQLTLIDTKVDGFDLLLDKIVSDERAAGRVVRFNELPATTRRLPPIFSGSHFITQTGTQYQLLR